MDTTRPDRKNYAYPAALRTAEAAQILKRRACNNADPDAPLVGVALSGGGIRSATFCIGLFQALARQRLVRRIDYLSTVSGGGYFGSFLGAAFSRNEASAEKVEKELSDNYSWSIQWLRDNGRFLSPNGAGDGWVAVAVMLRNWVALHLVLLTFAFLALGFGVYLRTELCTHATTASFWWSLERTLWSHRVAGVWWSPWLLLPVVPFVGLMLPAGIFYWLTQGRVLMAGLRRLGGRFNRRWAAYSDGEFVGHAQNRLTGLLVLGFLPAVVLLVFALVDSFGQTAYWKWARQDFQFPTLWASLTAIGLGVYGFGSKLYILAEKLFGPGRMKLTFDTIALVASAAWLLLIVLAISVAACALAWNGAPVEVGGRLRLMTNPGLVGGAVVVAFVLSWWFSRSFGFVNLSTLQQIYAARLRRAYIGATNPHRQASRNHSMTDLIKGDDICLDDYEPQARGGFLHLINVTVNETLSAKSQIERRDRKGVAMAVGPCGLSVGTSSHALWTTDIPRSLSRVLLTALFEDPVRAIAPIGTREELPFHALRADRRPLGSDGVTPQPQTIEALSLGRWISISGAAFTTGLGAGTHVGLSLLLGLANVRLGYWWDSGIAPGQREAATRSNVLERVGRVFERILPVQTCLLHEFFARFHGPARQHWYLSDGGHFENTACYELIRRRVPFIICTDAGQDPLYQFADLANLVRKARTDFGAEIELIRRSTEADKREPGHRLPSLEQMVHPSLVDMFGSPDEFPALREEGAAPEDNTPPASRRHALLARIRYFDTDEICWLLLIKPSLGGDEPIDVMQYQRTHPIFPQEPTSDQYFDEAQWESYRKLAEHIGTSLFTAPDDHDPRWSPSRFAPPEMVLAEEVNGHPPPPPNKITEHPTTAVSASPRG